MASENAIVPTESKRTLVSTASREFLSKPATPPISGITSNDLCDRCSRFNFGKLIFSSESLDVFERSYGHRGPKRTLHGNCPLCKVIQGRMIGHGTYRYEHNAVIHENGASGRVVFFLVNLDKTTVAYVHKLQAEDSPPCAISLDIGKANLRLARKWIRLCCQKHEGTCREKLEHVVPGLKVIDCISREICVATHGNPYVALSYVWGSPLPESHELLGEVPQTFPRTIEDAMAVAKELDIPYLWVDRYCIDQNNQKEKHTVISNMDKIYSGAELTIIAAAGSDPQYGLPGVSTTIRHRTLIDTFSHGSLLSWMSSPLVVDQSHWATRGWTYQEMVLSRCRLVFTDSEMLFQCCSGQFQEHFNITVPSDPIPNVSKLACPDLDRYFGWGRRSDTFPKNRIGESAGEIYPRIEEYTARQLSYPGDIISAFNGIFSAFGRSMQEYESHFWGIPILSTHSEISLYQWTQSFVAGLAWYVWEPCDRRPGLWPSWSWTAVMGEGVRWNHTSYEVTKLELQNPLTYTFTHNTGAKENVPDFVRGKRDYTEYDRCVDVTTWVLQDCEVITRQGEPYPVLVHPSFGSEISFSMYLDVDISEEEEISPAYVAVFFLATEGQSVCLVAQEIEDGSLRRVGLIKFWHTEEVCRDSEITGELTWLPGKEPRNSFNEWKWKTVRLK
jgi:hypothetical protein